MTLRFAPRAVDQLANIREYLASRRPESAELVRGRILATIGRLRELPRMGDTGGIARTRELGVAGLPYVAVYRIAAGDDELVILGVFHARQTASTQGLACSEAWANCRCFSSVSFPAIRRMVLV